MYKGLDERELARFCRDGKELAGDELYRRYAARIYTLCRRYMGDDEDAEDLMQEVLIQALDKIQSFNYIGTGSLYAWISRIAVNKALNHIKRRRWRKVSLDFDGRDNIPEPAAEDVLEIPEERLLEWISRLPDVRRAVFNLYCIEGYSHKEIGKLLGISEKASASVLAKARKQLKERIKSYQEESGR